MATERFGFGENWADYIEHNFSEDRLNISKNYLLEFLKLPNLEGRTFLDIGCGSGLHSLAAFRAGAAKVMSFDYDENSVATTQKLREFAGNPDNWTVIQGSVLDRTYMESLPKADIVYSWGVLHHTGDMWTAIENAALPLAADGVFYIALYSSDIYIDPTPEYWLKIKQAYNEASELKKRLMEGAHSYRTLFKPMLKQRKNPFKVISEYKKSRGMSYWTDVRDWLGGWPMEFAGNQETKDFCRDKLGLELLNITAGEGNTEFLFRRAATPNYWDDYRASTEEVKLNGPFDQDEGNAWIAPLSRHIDTCDSESDPRRSHLMLFEDGVPLGFGHVPRGHIRAYGKSRYCHWDGDLLFSTTDNSDPNTNGRTYSYCIDMLQQRP